MKRLFYGTSVTTMEVVLSEKEASHATCALLLKLRVTPSLPTVTFSRENAVSVLPLMRISRQRFSETGSGTHSLPSAIFPHTPEKLRTKLRDLKQ